METFGINKKPVIVKACDCNIFISNRYVINLNVSVFLVSLRYVRSMIAAAEITLSSFDFIQFTLFVPICQFSSATGIKDEFCNYACDSFQQFLC